MTSALTRHAAKKVLAVPGSKSAGESETRGNRYQNGFVQTQFLRGQKIEVPPVYCHNPTDTTFSQFTTCFTAKKGFLVVDER